MDEYSTNSYEDFFFMMVVGIFLLEIAVGAFQLFGALIRTIICINHNEPIGKLKIYWIMVGIYFLVFAGLYFTSNYIISSIDIGTISETTNYMDRFQWYSYLMIAQIVWIFLAWGIAIWYCINIVFVKRKLINSSTL